MPKRSSLFRGRRFRDESIVLWSLDRSTIARWVLRYAPVLNERLRRNVRRPAGSWRVDETCGVLSSA